jgi:micrococcal nuclease
MISGTMRFAAVLLPVTLATAAGAQSVEDQIRAEVDRYVAAINSGNAGTVASLYLNGPNTSSVGDGQIHRGWHRVAGLLRDVYEQAGTIRMTSDSVAITPLGSNAAVAVLRYQWIIGSTPPQSVVGAMTLVYTKGQNGWTVAHGHTSTLAPGSSAAPAAAGVDSGPTSPRRSTIPCTVIRITDGDGMVCDRIGRVRLIGIDSPELNQEPYGRRAAAALGGLIRVGMQVQLEPDVEARDRYGRMLAYVWSGRTMVNWWMVREGWAVLLTYAPNVQYVEAFAEAERLAREGSRGLWGIGGFECRPADHRARRCD